MTSDKFEDYRYSEDPSARNPLEADSAMTTPEDYIFETFKQPPSVAEAIAAHLGHIAHEIDSVDTDEQENRKIVNSAAIEERKHPRVDAPETHEMLPSTYSMDLFTSDTNAAYATDLLCTAWLELYNRQVETGDYPIVKEDRTHHGKGRLPRLVPRVPAKQLPDGSKSESIEIYLTPELYLKYLQAGLIPEGPGGQDGKPRLYWFEYDGDGYTAGTNASKIYRTSKMNPLSAANVRGTFNSVEIALRKIPTLLSAPEQDQVDSREAQAADTKRREQARYQRMGGSYYMHSDW